MKEPGTDLLVIPAASLGAPKQERVRDTKKPRRRPHEMNPDFMYECGKLHMTQREVGQLCGITQARVSQKLSEDPDLRESWELGQADGAKSLRRLQFDAAEKGNIVAQIWLGKNILNQRDSPKEIDIHNDTQVTFTAVWGGRHPDGVEAGDDGPALEGELEDE